MASKKKAPAKAVESKPVRADNFQNLVTGLGNISRDKRMSGVPYTYALSTGDLTELMRGNDLAARAVETPADMMTREGFDVLIQDDSELSEAIEHKLRDLCVQDKLHRALMYQGGFGGGLVVIGAMDGADLEQLAEPLNENRIQDIAFLNVFSAAEVRVLEWYNNPYEARFGEPRVYQITPKVMYGGGSTALVRTTMFNVHESRTLRFCGPWVSQEQLQTAMVSIGWGDSVLVKMYGVLRDFGQTWEGAATLMQDFSQAVIGMKGLAEAMASDNEGLINRRMVSMDMSRSWIRALLLDADNESFERKSTPIAGMPEMMDRFCNRVAAAARMPVSLLMGQAPAGLNATGDSDIRWFYDEMKARQGKEILPQLTKLVRLLMLSKSMGGKLADNWSIKFRPLWQMSETQLADIRVKMSQADTAYLNAGVLSAEEVAESRFGGDAYSIEVQLDRDSRDLMESAQAGEVEGDEGPEGPDDFPKAVPTDVVQPSTGGSMPNGETKLQDTALNGAQITSALAIVQEVAAGRLPRDAAMGMLQSFFNMTETEAAQVMGSVGKGFTPAAVVTPIPAGE